MTKVALIGAVCVLAACAGTDAVPPTGILPGTADGANLRLAQVVLTQGAQEPDGSIPLVAGMPAAVNVMIARSKESAREVPVVLRLFRGSAVVRIDTTRTVGILGPSISPASPSAQFLIPAEMVNDSLSWQVEIDPAQSVADSTRVDNQLPEGAPQSLSIVHLPTLDVHFVPIALATQGDVMGDVSELNAAQYLAAARAMLPTGRVTFSIGAAVSVQANFGTRPDGGDTGFWQSALTDLDVARMLSSSPASTWYGIVPFPAGYTRLVHGGYSYIPSVPSDVGGGSRSAISLGFTSQFGAAYIRETVAHELGHQSGRSHAPGCGAIAPLDTLFPGALGTITTPGHDVFSWSTGLTNGARSRAGSTGDVMSYCYDVWSSSYTWNAVMKWRQASGAVATSTVRTSVTLVAGSIGRDGAVTLRPALTADAQMPADDPQGDVTVELRGASGSVLRSVRVRSSALSESSGERQFIALLRSAGSAAIDIVATTGAGASARLQRNMGPDVIAARVTASGATEITSSAGNALLVRNAADGEVLSIGWNGRVLLRNAGNWTVTVSDGVRSQRREVQMR